MGNYLNLRGIVRREGLWGDFTLYSQLEWLWMLRLHELGFSGGLVEAEVSLWAHRHIRLGKTDCIMSSFTSIETSTHGVYKLL